jgi:uncharacterized membrane protein
MTPSERAPAFMRGLVAAVLAATATMVVLDLAWLGTFARGFYDAQMGPLLRPQAHVGAAATFYVLYIAFVLRHAVLPASSATVAARRGAELGFIVYAAYEFTNWAVITGWPPALVPVDLAWGVVLTAVVSFTARKAYEAVGRTRTE